MTTKIYQVLAIVLLLLSGFSAQAAITCNIGSPGFSAVYDFITTTPNDNMSSFTISCSRLSTDPSTLDYIAFTDDGLYNTGANNKAKLTTGTSQINYDFFTTSSFATNWSKSTKCIAGSVNFIGGSLSGSQSKSYYSRIPALQNTLPQGSYLDTVTLHASYNKTACTNNATQDASGNFSVAISNVPACEITLPPGNVAFSYTAFQASATTANTTFSTRCTTNLTYSVALDGAPTSGVYPGVVSGLKYGLAIGTTAGGAAILPTTSFSGNGTVLTYYINGTMAAGQAGSCAVGSATCTASDPRTLTITF